MIIVGSFYQEASQTGDDSITFVTVYKKETGRPGQTGRCDVVVDATDGGID